ncbi:MAG: hypothetical protein HOM11_07485 [Methylococcales bacterium]|jgi:hypothetical protein|nr:hypothetical protein [Methylococcales bacterium]MBT7444357.1 hypothetical protein [Methylococcales bacterium]
MGWFSKEKETTRSIEHPRSLQKGDMIQMLDSFSLPPELKGEALTVVAVNSYQYDDGDSYELTLKGSMSDPVFLTVEEEDGTTWLNFSLKIQRSDVDKLFTLDQFAMIFDSDDLVTIERTGDIDGLERWVSTRYTQTEQPYVGYYYENQDFRGQKISRYDEDDNGEQFETLALADPDEDYYINIEIWDGGETDVSLTTCRPLSDITEMYPGKDDS